MNKKFPIVILIFLLFVGAAVYVTYTGFMERNDVVITDFEVSEDGTLVTFTTNLTDSKGYIRTYEDKGGGVRPHYLVFYSTFGGINSPYKAKAEFTLELAPTDTEVYFSRPNNSFALMLSKNSLTGLWEKR